MFQPPLCFTGIRNTDNIAVTCIPTTFHDQKKSTSGGETLNIKKTEENYVTTGRLPRHHQIAHVLPGSPEIFLAWTSNHEGMNLTNLLIEVSPFSSHSFLPDSRITSSVISAAQTSKVTQLSPPLEWNTWSIWSECTFRQSALSERVRFQLCSHNGVQNCNKLLAENFGRSNINICESMDNMNSFVL